MQTDELHGDEDGIDQEYRITQQLREHFLEERADVD